MVVLSLRVLCSMLTAISIIICICMAAHISRSDQLVVAFCCIVFSSVVMLRFVVFIIFFASMP